MQVSRGWEPGVASRQCGKKGFGRSGNMMQNKTLTLELCGAASRYTLPGSLQQAFPLALAAFLTAVPHGELARISRMHGMARQRVWFLYWSLDFLFLTVIVEH